MAVDEEVCNLSDLFSSIVAIIDTYVGSVPRSRPLPLKSMCGNIILAVLIKSARTVTHCTGVQMPLVKMTMETAACTGRSISRL